MKELSLSITWYMIIYCIVALWHQHRPIVDYNDCSPGRGGMAQEGGTMGGTFHGEIDRCRESRGWFTACCSSMPERDGNGQGEDGPKQAGSSCWFARPRWLATSGANLYSPGGYMLPFFGFTFVLFCFVFVFFMIFSLKPRLLVHTFFVFRYACAPTATRSCFLAAGACVLFRCLFFLFLILWRCRYFPVFLYNYHFVFVCRVVVLVLVFTLKTVLTSIQYPYLSYSSRQRNEFPWSQANPK